MRKRGNKITFATSLLIFVCLIGSLTFPNLQVVFKVLSLLAFAFACAMSLYEESKKGCDVKINAIVMIVLLAILSYFFFF